MKSPQFDPLEHYRELPPEEMLRRSQQLLELMRPRRTVRQFSDRPVAREVLDNCIRTAGTAPSGANMQPWHFVVVSDADIKRQIREAAELEESKFYREAAPQEWLDALAPIGTDEHKPFLEVAPYLVVVMAQSYGLDPDEQKTKHYYVSESVGIATGFLIASVHNAGLASLTHTPSPMHFLNRVLHRPENERPFLILAVGHPAEDAVVPVLRRKQLEEIATFV